MSGMNLISRLMSRDFALYLNGLGVGALMVVAFVVNPSWPAWVGAAGFGVAFVVGLALVDPGMTGNALRRQIGSVLTGDQSRHSGTATGRRWFGTGRTSLHPRASTPKHDATARKYRMTNERLVRNAALPRREREKAA